MFWCGRRGWRRRWQKKRRASVPDLNTPAVVAAHPVAVMLALVAAKLQAKLALTSVAATVMEPASEYGRAAMDELHQQTVNLLSFQTLPREQYDAQVSFNLLPELGEAAKVKLGTTEQRIRRHYAGLSVRDAADACVADGAGAGVSWVCCCRCWWSLSKAVTVDEVEAALAGDHVDVVSRTSLIRRAI